MRAPFEALQVAVRGQKAVLQGVFGVFGVPEDPESGLEQRALVAAKQRFDRLRVAPLTRADQLRFIQLSSHCDLCCHHSPIRLINPEKHRPIPFNAPARRLPSAAA